MTRSISLHFIFYTFVLINSISCTDKKKSHEKQTGKTSQLASLKKNIGEKFPVISLVDTGGKSVVLEFSSYNETIIDFWFSECPPCLEEMKQFEAVLKGKEKKVQIISISINSLPVWQPIMTNHTGRFSFLPNNIINWKNYCLQSKEDIRLKNDIPLDNTALVKGRLNIAFYPAFFVVDKKGIITSRPISAVEYIKSL